MTKMLPHEGGVFSKGGQQSKELLVAVSSVSTSLVMVEPAICIVIAGVLVSVLFLVVVIFSLQF